MGSSTVLVTQDHVDEFVAKVQRDINCITDLDRNVRKRALEKLHAFLLKDQGAPKGALLQEIWTAHLLPVLLRNMGDPVEKCRELMLKLVSDVTRALPRGEAGGSSHTLPCLLCTLNERVGDVPVAEPSEEVRLQIATFVADVLIPQSDAAALEADVASLERVLCAELADPFHEIKKAACRSIMAVSRLRSGPVLKEERAGTLLKALLHGVGHSHSKVRHAVLQALDALMLSGGLPGGSVDDSMAVVIRQLAVDRASNVRNLFFTSVAGWMRPKIDRQRDAAGLGGQGAMEEGGKSVGSGDSAAQCMDDPRPLYPTLLPLLLLGVTDESAEISAKALACVELVGASYVRLGRGSEALEGLEEGRSRCEGKVQEMVTDGTGVSGGASAAAVSEIRRVGPSGNGVEVGPAHPKQLPLPLPPPFLSRPSPSARQMVCELLPKLLAPILADLQEWTSSSRIIAVRVLHTALIFADEGATVRHLDRILSTLCSAVGDEELAVAERVVACAHVLGSYVAPSYWLPLMVDTLGNPRSNAGQRASALVITAALLRATPPPGLSEAELRQLSKVLLQNDVQLTDSSAVRRQLLATLVNCIRVCGATCGAVSADFFLLLLQLQAGEDDSSLQESAGTALAELAAAQGLEGPGELYSRHVADLLRRATSGHQKWNAQSPGWLLLQAALRGARERAGPFLPELLLPVLEKCVQPDRDAPLQVGVLQLLDEMFDVPDLEAVWRPLGDAVMERLLVPPSTWRLGKTAAAVRFAAMTTLGTFLRRQLCSPAQLSAVLAAGNVMRVLKGCLEEDYFAETRRAACQALVHLLILAGPAGLNEEQRRSIYPELLKRLDDSNSRVRALAAETSCAFFESMPRDYDATNLRYFVDGLLIHMDDSDPEFQERICTALEFATMKNPSLVAAAVSAVRGKHRSPIYCDRVLAIAKSSGVGA